ncbi:MAG: DMT family transporter [Smithellaceae bacterium]|nr:DMT family transporter [Smithellaceae bacterium]
MELTKGSLLKGLIFSLISAVSMGLLGILGKIGYRAGMSELEMLQNRWFYGAAMLFIYIFLTDRRALRISGITLLKTAILGAFFHGVAGFTFFKAIRYIPVSTTLLIIYFYPVVVTLASAYLFKMRLSRTVILSLIFILTGSSLVFFDAFAQDLNSLGIIYAVVNMIVFSGYMIAAQIFLRGEKPLVMTCYMAMFAGLAFSFFHSPLKIMDSGPEQILIGLSLGLIPTVIAYFFSFRALREVGSGYVSIFSTFEPVTVLVLGYLVLGERMFVYQVFGMVLIIGGIVLPNLFGFLTRGEPIATDKSC